jgi:hypothetical protein
MNIEQSSRRATQLVCLVFVVTCWASRAFGESWSSEDWRFFASGQIRLATTSSTSGAELGVFCDEARYECVAFVSTGLDCAQDRSVPVLANADTGASVHDTVCRRLTLSDGPIWVNVFQDFDSIEQVILIGTRVGFAIPIGDTQFQSLRFSLAGSNRAVAAARTAPENRRSAPRQDSTF